MACNCALSGEHDESDVGMCMSGRQQFSDGGHRDAASNAAVDTEQGNIYLFQGRDCLRLCSQVSTAISTSAALYPLFIPNEAKGQMDTTEPGSAYCRAGACLPTFPAFFFVTRTPTGSIREGEEAIEGIQPAGAGGQEITAG
jgi:hypothetical protein